MLFNSFVFFFFLIFVVTIYYNVGIKYRKLLLLISSYVFYGYWDYRFTILLAISTLVDFLIGKKLYVAKEKNEKKKLLLLSVCVNLGILALFKYYDFFVDSFSAIAGQFNQNLDYLHLNIILPVGISFYTFQTMSYTIDIYRDKLKPTKSIIDFAVFVSFFPQLVAGPIERARNLLPQIAINKLPSKEQINSGIVLIVMGLFKKVLIGDTTGRIVDQIFSQPEIYKSPELLSALILFSIQIYADFSGYSNIARGTAKLLGFELMKNFEQPYLSRNITEFWRRWHISLSSWLKDYLYISLGGNRKSEYKTYLNLFITMLLGGLWHGASWNFVIWGGLHGLYLAIHKVILKGKKVELTSYIYNGFYSFLKYLLQVLLTYIIVLFAWLFFRATDFDTSIYFIEKMIYWEISDLSARFFRITFFFVAVTLLYDFFEYRTKNHSFMVLIRNKHLRLGILLAIFLLNLLYMFNNEPLPFMYFQF
jgi:D-alanyl-lipoteichoic acid acyltransferase DltB (MBOAT superfamily)